MRIEEICQLHLSDVREVEGVMCFSVNEELGFNGTSKHVKTIAGIRNVPIHPWLWKEAGLSEFVASPSITEVSVTMSIGGQSINT